MSFLVCHINFSIEENACTVNEIRASAGEIITVQACLFISYVSCFFMGKSYHIDTRIKVYKTGRNG